MGRKEQLRTCMLANKPFLLNLYTAENNMQELSVLSQGTKEEIVCLFHVLLFIQKGDIPVKSGKKMMKKLKKVGMNRNHLEILDKSGQFHKVSKLIGLFKTLLAPLFEMPK